MHSIANMEFENDAEPGRCFDCGGPAPWIILISGEDEQPHEEWACEVHARGHWRWALVTPPSTEVLVIDDTDARYAW
ncbi:MAG: hypothetical protein BGO98_44585 [Myxococcales bacterium 68-20]|nr:hypothetical protein [Myxococcales bacterium]OJY26994.1 MAG: hypothetical protein BGO98_44585 [Myxococcales bacterium 68-20]